MQSAALGQPPASPPASAAGSVRVSYADRIASGIAGGAATDYDVCVQGAGPVGASLALALSHLGCRVALVAHAGRFDPRDDDLRAYALNASTVALLTRLRVWAALTAAARTPVHHMRVHGDAGGRLDFSAWQQGVTELAWIVDAAALERCLGEALRYAPGVDIVGQPVPAGLLAVCEGRESAQRAALGVHHERHAYGHSAVAARLVCDAPHHHTAWQWFRSPDVLALLPLDRPVAEQSFGLVWSMLAAEAAQHLASDDASFEAALNAAVESAVASAAHRSGPPASPDRGAATREHTSAAGPGRLRLASARAAWPLVRANAQPWTGEGWALLGDAAHAMHPLAGQGLNTGLADVACLVQVLGQSRQTQPWRSLGDARLLRRYARARAAPAAAMSNLVDGLWQVFAHDASADRLPLQALRNGGLQLINQAGPLKHWLVGRALDAS